MLKRKMENTLLKWKQQAAKKAMCIIGARQTGKSTTAREFGRMHYEQVIELNFISSPQSSAIFSSSLEGKELLRDITAYTGKKIIDGNTLLILDEIQECPDARTAVKFLVEDGRVDIIETGSLLGVNFNEVRSYPVGYEQIENMYPLDFEEFLWACSLPEETWKLVQSAYDTRTQLSATIHSVLSKLFYTYIAVGGMPEAVWQYVQSHDMARVLEIQTSILQLYRSDIAKYASKTQAAHIKAIFNSLPGQLDAKNRRFKLSVINKNAKMNRYENDFLWLKEAGVALSCYNTSALAAPLRLNEKRNLFKLYLCDTGLLCAATGDVQFEILRGNTELNCGSLLENVFAQSFASKNRPLYYYDNKKTELDFLLEDRNEITAVEIKSGKDYKRHASLDKALQTECVKKAVVFCANQIEQEENILYLPFYMIPFFGNRKTPDTLIWEIDLKELEL